MKTIYNDSFQPLDIASLAAVHGGNGRLGFNVGWLAGQTVTRAIAPFNQDLAFTQVGGPFLRKVGFPNAANGAETAVREVAAEYGHPVKESSR